MSDRGERVVIRNALATRYYWPFGATSCVESLVAGEGSMKQDLTRCEISDWLNPRFCEGGSLVDFDERNILLYCWDRTLLAEAYPKIKESWPGWNVLIVKEGAEDFECYVYSRK